MPLALTLAEVVNVGLERLRKSIRVSMPGRIVDFDAAEQTATVKPLLYDVTESEDGTEGSVSVDVIHRVPIHVAGGGGYASTFPIAKDDECLIVFGDRSLDNWFAKGGDQDPVDRRRHDLSDAIAIVGIRSNPSKLTDYDTSRAVVGNKGPRIAFDGTNVHLGVGHGEDGSDFVAMAAKVKSEISALRDTVNSFVSTYNSHMHDMTKFAGNGIAATTTWAAAPGDFKTPTGTPIGNAQSPAAVQDVKSSCVKLK